MSVDQSETRCGSFNKLIV